jgi:arylsulfatase A-like enzyme
VVPCSRIGLASSNLQGMIEPRPRRSIRRFLLAIASLLATAFTADSTAAADGGPHPNVVLIVADDMGFADVGFNGATDTKTPNLDKLAASGVKLDQFYVQPLCSPTRAALLTGRYPMRHGLQVGVVRPWAGYGLPLEERTLAQALKDAGYETAISGKWHLGHVRPEYLPTRRGFDHQYGHYNGQIDYNTHIRDGGFDWHRNDKASRDEGYATHLIAAEAVKRINEKAADKPLFLYVPFNAVHSPHQVPDKYTAPFAHLKGKRMTYAGMLAAMDEGIGQILAALNAKGMTDDTLVIFTSDNGGASAGKITDNGPLRAGKGSLYEGGVRVAACAAWPGKIPAGGTVAQPMHAVDVYPTVLKLAGVDVADASKQKLPVDGVDVCDAIASGTKLPERPILLNATPLNGAVRLGDWKLIVGVGRGLTAAEGGEATAGAGANADDDDAGPAGAAGKAAPTKAARRQAKQLEAARGGTLPADAGVELFNLAADPGEKNNVAAQNPDKVKELRAAFDRLAAQAVPPKNQPKPAGFQSPAVWGE